MAATLQAPSYVSWSAESPLFYPCPLIICLKFVIKLMALFLGQRSRLYELNLYFVFMTPLTLMFGSNARGAS